jgi:outer membrane protein
MRYRHLLLCLALAAPAASANELLRIYDLAVQNDPTLAAAAHQRDAGLQARPAARAALLPQVNASYGYSKQNEEGTEGFSGQPAQPFERDGTNKGTTVTLRQSVFDWAAIESWRQAGDQAALAEIGYRAAEQGLVLRLAEAYFGVLSAADNLRSTEAENKAVGRQLEQAKKRFEVGLSAITDVQEAQARYDLTVAQSITAQQALDSAREGLSTIIGLSPQNLVHLQDDLPLPAPDPANVDHWLNGARENNLDLLSAQLNAAIADRAVGVARARHYPTVGAQLQYQDATAEGSRFSGNFETESYGFEVTLPIFSGGAAQAGVRSAAATHEQRKAEYEAIKRQVDKRTRDAYQGVIAGAATVKAYKQAVVSSTTALEASETGLQVGARTAVDVLNAQQQLYAAERIYSQSRYDYLLNVLRLKLAAGRLGPQDLAEIDRLLVSSGG